MVCFLLPFIPRVTYRLTCFTYYISWICHLYTFLNLDLIYMRYHLNDTVLNSFYTWCTVHIHLITWRGHPCGSLGFPLATLWLLGLAVRAKAWNGLLGKICFFCDKIHGGERFDKLFPGVPEGSFHIIWLNNRWFVCLNIKNMQTCCRLLRLIHPGNLT